MTQDGAASRRWTGQPLARFEDADFVTGGARFLDDHAMDAPCAMAVRSPMAHARVVRLEVEAARRMPGVLGLYTAADLAASGLATLPLDFPPPPAVVADPTWQPARQAVLAGERVRFVGEAVALVVAETKEAAFAAVEAVEVEYEELPACTDVATARASGVIVDPLYSDNRVLRCQLGDEAATERAFTGAARRLALALRSNRVAASPLEPRGCIARYDPALDAFELMVGTQRPYDMQRLLAGLFRVPSARMRVRVPRTGGGFGMKNGLYPEYVLCLHAARQLRRPVKWVAQRSESLLSDNHSRDNLFEAEAAVDAAGRIQGLRVRRTVNLGAYTAPRTMVPVTNGLTHLTGVYAVRAASVEVEAVLTNTACTAAYRGAGRPENVYCCERLMDWLARSLGQDPIAFRRAHLLQAGTAGATALGANYHGADFARLLDAALARAHHGGFTERAREARLRGRIAGFGVALFVEALHGSERPAPAALIAKDGRLCIAAPTVSTGHGHETAFRQIAADVLGLAPEELGFLEGDTAAISDGLGTAASWSVTLGGSSVHLAALAAVNEAKRILGRELEVAAGDIAFENGLFSVVGTDLRRRWPDVLAAAPAFRAAATFAARGESAPAACHVCEVELDPETGAVAVRRYVVAQDCGDPVNPLLVEGQLHGGIAQGIGQAWQEEVVYEPASGQLLSGSLMDYALPRAADLPAFEISLHPTPEESNPIRVKGVGEAGTTGAVAAFANAVHDALAPFGVLHVDLPLTPARLWQAIVAEQAK